MSRRFRVTPDVSLEQELDADDRVARTPRDHTIKGMFLTRHARWLEEELPALRPQLLVQTASYNPFGDYPQADHARLAIAAARKLFPALPLAEGLRRVERHAADVFVGSSVGRVLSSLASDPSTGLRMFPMAWRHMQTGGELTVVPGSRGVRIEVRDLAPWLDCSMIGSLEGAVVFFGRRPVIEVELTSDFDASYEVTWT